MRAQIIDAFRQPLRLDAVPAPAAPPTGHVVVRVEAAAMNPADLKVLGGETAGRFLHAAKFPLVAGFDFCGVVDAAGAGVDLIPGTTVFGHLPYAGQTRQGTLCERIVVPAAAVGRAPDGFEATAIAATATTASTALQALRDKGGLKAGGRVLVNGASGGVGSHAVQIAKILGATVTGTCSAAKADFVRSLGCDAVVDYRKTALTDLEGPFDVVFDAAAATRYRQCRPVMAPDGVFLTTLPSGGFVLDVLASLFSRRRVRMVVVQSRRADLDQLAEWMAEGRLRTELDSTFDFDQAQAAIERLGSGRVMGKVAVRVA